MGLNLAFSVAFINECDADTAAADGTLDYLFLVVSVSPTQLKQLND